MMSHRGRSKAWEKVLRHHFVLFPPPSRMIHTAQNVFCKDQLECTTTFAELYKSRNYTSLEVGKASRREWRASLPQHTKLQDVKHYHIAEICDGIRNIKVSGRLLKTELTSL
jgi:hypothetical protein